MNTFKDLFLFVEKEKVFEELIKAYPKEVNNLDAYETVWNKLVSTEPTPDETEMMIVVEWVEPHFEDEEGYMNVSGIDLSDENKVRYAIEFTPWDKWLGYYIPETLKISKEEFLAHCLWEMTFVSFEEEEIQAEIQQLEKQVEDIENGTAKFKTWDEVKMALALEEIE